MRISVKNWPTSDLKSLVGEGSDVSDGMSVTLVRHLSVTKSERQRYLTDRLSTFKTGRGGTDRL